MGSTLPSPRTDRSRPSTGAIDAGGARPSLSCVFTAEIPAIIQLEPTSTDSLHLCLEAGRLVLRTQDGVRIGELMRDASPIGARLTDCLEREFEYAAKIDLMDDGSVMAHVYPAS